MDLVEIFTIQIQNEEVRVATSLLSEDIIYCTFIGNLERFVR